MRRTCTVPGRKQKLTINRLLDKGVCWVALIPFRTNYETVRLSRRGIRAPRIQPFLNTFGMWSHRLFLHPRNARPRPPRLPFDRGAVLPGLPPSENVSALAF